MEWNAEREMNKPELFLFVWLTFGNEMKSYIIISIFDYSNIMQSQNNQLYLYLQQCNLFIL